MAENKGIRKKLDIGRTQDTSSMKAMDEKGCASQSRDPIIYSRRNI